MKLSWRGNASVCTSGELYTEQKNTWIFFSRHDRMFCLSRFAWKTACQMYYFRIPSQIKKRLDHEYNLKNQDLDFI